MMGVPMDHILATAGWSSERTFQHFYYKPVAAPETFAGENVKFCYMIYPMWGISL